MPGSGKCEKTRRSKKTTPLNADNKENFESHHKMVDNTPAKIPDFFPASPPGKQQPADDNKKTNDTIENVSNSEISEEPSACSSKVNNLSKKSAEVSINLSTAATQQESESPHKKITQLLDNASSIKTKDLPRPSHNKPKGTGKMGKGSKSSQGKSLTVKSVDSAKTSKSKSVPKKSSDAKNQEIKNKEGMKQKTLPDYYKIRRSARKTKGDIEKEERKKLEDAILTGQEDGLLVKKIDDKGRGVFSTRPFKRGEFVVEYAGDLIDIPKAKQRDEEYSKDSSKGCYMYYFKFKSRNYCIDATSESEKLGRLLNHSKQGSNCITKLVEVGDRPYLILVANEDIATDTELLYDYGDRSKSSIESHPWLKS